jgi:hypothetical protein
MTASAKPHRRLASCMYSRDCVPSMRNRFNTAFNGIRARLDRRRLMQLLTTFHHYRRRIASSKVFSQSQNGIQSP